MARSAAPACRRPGFLALLLSGALQIGFAMLGLARLARVVPQPVLADAAQVAVVVAQLQVRHLKAGEVLFAEGEPGDRLYVVSKGSVSVLSTPDRHGRTQRYLSASPGMMIGETAMLDGGGRTAGAVADASTDVHALTLDALDGLGRTHPAVAIRLHRNLALHLSQRLRGAATAWRASGH
jgi:CRP-like cAMP-binding protein